MMSYEPASVKEKRQFLRIPTRQAVEIQDSYGPRSANCRDLGVGGLALYLEETPSVGSLVNILFELPSGHRVDAMCVVVRVAGVVGLRFVHLEPSEVTAIHSFIVNTAWAAD